jgi:hypothetical protein
MALKQPIEFKYAPISPEANYSAQELAKHLSARETIQSGRISDCSNLFFRDDSLTQIPGAEIEGFRDSWMQDTTGELVKYGLKNMGAIVRDIKRKPAALEQYLFSSPIALEEGVHLDAIKAIQKAQQEAMIASQNPVQYVAGKLKNYGYNDFQSRALLRAPSLVIDNIIEDQKKEAEEAVKKAGDLEGIVVANIGALERMAQKHNEDAEQINADYNSKLTRIEEKYKGKTDEESRTQFEKEVNSLNQETQKKLEKNREAHNYAPEMLAQQVLTLENLAVKAVEAEKQAKKKSDEEE